MNLESFAQIGGLALISAILAFAVLWALSRTTWQDALKPSLFSSPPRDNLVFLFEADTLISATDHGNDILSGTDAGAGAGGTDWQRFLSVFGPRFANLERRLEALPELCHLVLHALDTKCLLIADWRNGVTRISIVDAPANDAPVELDRASFDAMENELDTLRATAENAPFLVWRQRPDGTITWANSAYLELAEKGRPDSETPVWPPARLFDLSNTRIGEPVSSRRATTHIATEAEPRWFECFETPMDGESLYTAVSADKVVKAELDLRNFIQTLTKTFAHLTVGLAIFDKQRRLKLFNPALADLTALQPEFLSSRPTLLAILDRLRANKMAPEPKDYKTWRHQLHALEAAAVNGTYEDTWSLANGCTYRVVGRPHPDGALAFIFEDISAEISLTRRFKSELETGQAVLDALDEALVVFSPGGALLMSNTAYTCLWQVDSDTMLTDLGITDALDIWAKLSLPTTVWGDLRAFAGMLGERHEWSASVQLRDGRGLACRFSPIPGGATLVRFRPGSAAKATPKSTGADPLRLENSFLGA